KQSGELYIPGVNAWQGYQSIGFERSTGRLYALTTAGELRKLADPVHFQNVWTGVKQFGADEYGRLVLLKTTGELYVPGVHAWQGYQSIGFERSTGRLYALTTAGELRNLADPAHWQTAWTGVKQFGTDEYGRLVLLKTTGELYVPGVNAWQGYQSIG